MSRHWKPEDGKVVRIEWARAESYRARRKRLPVGSVLLVLFLAACIGLVVGYTQTQVPEQRADTSAIEWNSVQAVPQRERTSDELAWEQRGQDSRAALESAPEPSSAPAVRASFGYCHAGGGTNCVVDGDTFWIGGEKVRIAGIDAPETHPPRCEDEARLGRAATEKLHALLNSGAVTMTSIDRDRDTYGRRLRNVAVDGQDVGNAMITDGVAREYAGRRRPWCVKRWQ